MPLLERVRTGRVVVGFFCHEVGEPAVSMVASAEVVARFALVSVAP